LHPQHRGGHQGSAPEAVTLALADHVLSPEVEAALADRLQGETARLLADGFTSDSIGISPCRIRG
jgi:hypothetical protein